MVVNLESGTRVHIVGIGGAGMSGLARLLHEMGCVVSGSDAQYSMTLEELAAAGIEVRAGHDASQMGEVDVALWSPAIKADNVELIAAQRQGAALMSRSEILQLLSQRQSVVGLTGTHGKTTATSMMAMVLHAEGLDYSRLIGTPVLGLGANGHYGEDGLVLEVDESFGTFGLLSPYALGLLNVEADHLDHYGDVQTLERAFVDLVERTSGPVVAWIDDPGASRVVERCSREIIKVGRDASCEWRVENEQVSRRGSSFQLVSEGRRLDIELAVTGAHNIANAAVVAALALPLGVSEESVVTGLARFQGAPRRFQFRGSWSGVDVYEDYAHLPGEIAATLSATCDIGYRRIGVVFQPHRVTRTLNLAESFASCFTGAAFVVVTNIYSAGEANPTGVTGEIVADLIRARNAGITVWYESTFEEVISRLQRIREQCDVLLLLGAGDIAEIASEFEGMVL